MATSENENVSDVQLQDGEAVTPTGEVVTMGTETEDRKLRDLARKLIRWAKRKQAAKKKVDNHK